MTINNKQAYDKHHDQLVSGMSSEQVAEAKNRDKAMTSMSNAINRYFADDNVGTHPLDYIVNNCLNLPEVRAVIVVNATKDYWPRQVISLAIKRYINSTKLH